MSCEGKIYVGQVGVMFEVSTWVDGCPTVDWSSATTTELVVLLPNKTTVVFDADVNSDGHTLVYVTDSEEDLPVKGTYKMQAHVAGDGYDALGETATFIVYDQFK
jgi:hypothetical protein